MIPINPQTFTTTAPITVTIPPHPLTSPIPLVNIVNRSAVALALQAGSTFGYIMPFSSHRLTLDGTENTIVLTPDAAPPAPGTIAGEFYTSGDIQNGLVNSDSGTLYVPPVRLALVTIPTNTVITAFPVTHGPFYVGDYEDIIFSFQGFRNDGQAWVLRFSWYSDALATNLVTSVTYEKPYTNGTLGALTTITAIDKLSNLGPYLVVSIEEGSQGHGVSGPSSYSLNVVARQAIGSTDSAFTQNAAFQIGTTILGGATVTQKLQTPQRAGRFLLQWAVNGPTGWRLTIQTLIGDGSANSVPVYLDAASGAPTQGTLSVSLPGHFCFMTFNSGATSTSVVSSLLPDYS